MSTELEQQLGDGVADGRISAEDADTIREFAAFLADPEVTSPKGPPMPMSALRRHRNLLGLTDEELQQAAIGRGEQPAKP
jgi:hypothetical protein